MTKQELVDLVNSTNEIPSQLVPEALQIFRSDAFRGNSELLDTFCSFVRKVPLNKNEFSSKEYHTINQMYIHNALGNMSISNESLASLFIRNIDYYSSMNASAEAIRYINLILDMDDLPDLFYMIALSFLLTLASDGSMRDQAMPYLQKYISFFDNNSLNENTFYIMRLNLLEAYIKLDMKKEFIAEKTIFERILPEQISPYTISMTKLLMLAGDIALSDKPVTPEQIECFKEISLLLSKEETGIMSHISGFLMPLISKLRGQVPDDLLITSLLKLVPITSSECDKVNIYEYLFGRLKIDREKYKDAYDDYFFILRSYYKSMATFSQQEALTEIRFNRINKFSSLNARKSGMSSIAVIYISMHMIDLEKDCIEILKTNEFIEALREINREDGASNQISRVMSGIVLPEYKEQILEFVDLSTINERLGKRSTISIEFEGRINGWCRARFIASKRNKKGKLKEIIYAVEPIEEQKTKEFKYKNLSETDWLTGIKNRGLGETTIQNYILNNVYGMLCIIDADEFKNINDSYGHIVGDEVIKQIARCLTDSFKREDDLVFRLGGDEFAAYAPGITNQVTAEKIMKRLFAAIDEIKIPELKYDKLSISVGIAFYRKGIDSDFEMLYKKADAGTYKSKTIEGNSYTFIN